MTKKIRIAGTDLERTGQGFVEERAADEDAAVEMPLPTITLDHDVGEVLGVEQTVWPFVSD